MVARKGRFKWLDVLVITTDWGLERVNLEGKEWLETEH